MQSQPHNPEFKNHPENFHPCVHLMRKSSELEYVGFWL